MHIGESIRKELERQGRTITWLAEQLPCHRTNIYRIFDKPSIDTRTLLHISQILEYDFFAELTKEFNLKKV